MTRFTFITVGAGLMLLLAILLALVLRSPFITPTYNDERCVEFDTKYFCNIMLLMLLISQLSLSLTSLLWLSLPLLCSSSVSRGYNRGNVTDFPGECFFSDSYEDARTQFVKLAEKCNAEIFSLPIDNSEGGLTTDVAILRRSRERVVVHISGTHGDNCISK